MCSVNNGLSGSAWNSLGEGCDRDGGPGGAGGAAPPPPDGQWVRRSVDSRWKCAASRSHVRIIGESGEDYLYPKRMFPPVKVRPEARAT